MGNQLSATLGSTVFPLISLLPSTAAPAEPERRLTGRASLAHRENTYYTEVNDFSGPFGQETWDMDSTRQGFRDGSLLGTEDYLVLPPGFTEELDPVVAEPTTFVVFPGNVGIASNAADRASGIQAETRQFVAVGPAVWRSDLGVYTFSESGNPVLDFPNKGEAATQITSIIRVSRETQEYIWVAGASATGDHVLYYSADGTSFSASNITGEAVAAVGTGLAGSYPEIVVAKSDGSIVRVNPSGETGPTPVTTDIETESTGRTVFLGPGWYGGLPGTPGLWMIKGGRLMFINWSRKDTREGTALEELPSLPMLVHGCLHFQPVVTDGWNILRVHPDYVEWLGLPPNLTQFSQVRYVAVAEGFVWAVVIDGSSPANTSVLAASLTRRGEEDTTPIWERWQLVASLAGKTGYALHFGAPKPEAYVPTGAHKGLLMSYDAGESYIHSFDVPSPGGTLPPGGTYATTANRSMPIFTGGMPDVEGTWAGVDISWVFPDNTGTIQFHRRIGTATTWTQVGPTISGSSVGSASKAVYGVTELDESTAQAFTTIETRPTITGASPYNQSPRILGMVYRWEKHQNLRYTFALEIDAEAYMKHNGKEYDDLLADIATLYDTTTPLTLAVDGWTANYTVRFAKRGGVTIAPDQALRGDTVGNPILLLEEVE